MISLLTFAPVVAAVLILFVPDGKPRVARLLALLGALVSLVATLAAPLATATT